MLLLVNFSLGSINLRNVSRFANNLRIQNFTWYIFRRFLSSIGLFFISRNTFSLFFFNTRSLFTGFLRFVEVWNKRSEYLQRFRNFLTFSYLPLKRRADAWIGGASRRAVRERLCFKCVKGKQVNAAVALCICIYRRVQPELHSSRAVLMRCFERATNYSGCFIYILFRYLSKHLNAYPARTRGLD